MEPHIHPSILSADFMNFETEFKSISSADAIHVDVMDGHFVPNLTFGLPVVKQMTQITHKPLDVHLMIENADDLALKYAELGVSSVTFHQEAASDSVKVARKIRSLGSKAAIAVKPATSADFLIDNLHEFDMVLIMTVEPGFGGQKFMAEMLPKIELVAKQIQLSGGQIRLQVDGGIDPETILQAAKSGADTFVAGSSVFQATDRNQKIQDLRRLALSVS